MRLMLWVRDEGFTDQEYRDGDVFIVQPDTWEPGEKEKQKYLIVQTDDVSGSVQSELTEPEYSNGPGEMPTVRRMRKYRIDYAAKLDPELLAQVKDQTVSVEPIVGVFTTADIARK